jgi:sporadic carbohydrate cluster protein (TIGR04323 family)
MSEPSLPEYRPYLHCPSKSFNYPQRFQLLLVQDYARRHGLRLTLYVVEIFPPGIFYNLADLLAVRPRIRGIVAFTLEQFFPLSKGEPFLKKILAMGYEVRFAREEILLRTEDDLKPLWLLEATQRISQENEETLESLAEFCLPVSDRETPA